MLFMTGVVLVGAMVEIGPEMLFGGVTTLELGGREPQLLLLLLPEEQFILLLLPMELALLLLLRLPLLMFIKLWFPLLLRLLLLLSRLVLLLLLQLLLLEMFVMGFKPGLLHMLLEKAVDGFTELTKASAF